MRLGFRKASNGSSRGKRWNPKMKSSPASAASSDGTVVPWPPPWPGDDASGRGGSGPGGRGHRGVAERSGRGGAFAVRARTTGEGPTTVGEERSYQALLTTPRICGRGTAACRCFLDGSRARPSRRRAFSSAVRGCGRSRGRLRDRQLRVCALGREGGCSRARTGDGVLGQRHGLGDDVVSRHRTGVRRLLGRAQRGVDDPLNLRREVAWAQAARRLCGAGMQVREEYERQDEDGDARGHVAARAAIGLATAVSPVIVQSARPLRPTPPHDRFPHAVRSGRRPPPSHADESQTRRAPSSAIAVSVSGPAPPC